jgi:hypothetical protein
MFSSEELEQKARNLWRFVLASVVVAVASFMYFVFSVSS